MVTIECERCGNSVETYPSRIGRKKYCSKVCQNRSIARSGADHHKWKGEKAGYQAIHAWVWRKLGKAKYCELCNETATRFEWSNISGEYKRNIDDWRSLCVKCHRKVDDNVNKSWRKRHSNDTRTDTQPEE